MRLSATKTHRLCRCRSLRDRAPGTRCARRARSGVPLFAEGRDPPLRLLPKGRACAPLDSPCGRWPQHAPLPAAWMDLPWGRGHLARSSGGYCCRQTKWRGNTCTLLMVPFPSGLEARGPREEADSLRAVTAENAAPIRPTTNPGSLVDHGDNAPCDQVGRAGERVRVVPQLTIFARL